MEKEKENVIEINKTGGIESQSTYYANYIAINDVRVWGNIEINILVLLLNRKDDNASIFLEIYNLEIKDFEKNFIQFNFDYRDLEDYSFDKELLKSIIQTLNNATNYK